MKHFLAALALSAALATGACQTGLNVIQSTTQSTPAQANTLAGALNLDTVAARAVTVYVNTGNPNRATLIQLQTDARLVHDALVSLEQANAAGQSLNFAAFNAAYTAFQNYKTAQGIKP